MLPYLDMTFCPFYEKCAYKTGCSRQLTEEVKRRAGVINRPLSTFSAEPGCFVEEVTDKD